MNCQLKIETELLKQISKQQIKFSRILRAHWTLKIMVKMKAKTNIYWTQFLEAAKIRIYPATLLNSLLKCFKSKVSLRKMSLFKVAINPYNRYLPQSIMNRRAVTLVNGIIDHSFLWKMAIVLFNLTWINPRTSPVWMNNKLANCTSLNLTDKWSLLWTYQRLMKKI